MAGTGLWCVSPSHPDESALHLINTFQLQLVTTMMGLKRGDGVGWLEFRKHAFRAARGVLWRGKKTQKVEYTVGGKTLGVYGPPGPWSAAHVPINSYRSREWWEQQKAKKDAERIKHPRSFYPRLMLAETRPDTAAGTHWRVVAQDRAQWQGR